MEGGTETVGEGSLNNLGLFQGIQSVDSTVFSAQLHHQKPAPVQPSGTLPMWYQLCAVISEVVPPHQPTHFIGTDSGKHSRYDTVSASREPQQC